MWINGFAVLIKNAHVSHILYYIFLAFDGKTTRYNMPEHFTEKNSCYTIFQGITNNYSTCL